MIRALNARSLPAKVGAVVAAGAVEEGFAELFQDMLVDWGNGDLEWNKAGFEKYLTSFLVGGVVGGPMTGGFETPGLVRQARTNAQAQENGLTNSVMQSIQDQAGKVKLRTRSPEKWRAFLQSIGTEQGRMYVEPTTLQTAITEGTVDLPTLGLTQKQLDVAVETGGRVQINQIDWAANYAGGDVGQTLLDNSSTQANGYTPAQLRNFQDLVAQAEVESTFTAEQTKELDRRTTELRTERRLAMMREGMSNAEASANATLQASAIRTLAQRTGDIETVFGQFQLNIEGTTALGEQRAKDALQGRGFDQSVPTEAETAYNKTVRERASLLDRDTVTAEDNILYRPDRVYRFIGELGYADFLESGQIRAAQDTKKGYAAPYFMKGKSSSRYGKGESGAYMAEVIPTTDGQWQDDVAGAYTKAGAPVTAEALRIYRRKEDGSYEVVLDNIGDPALLSPATDQQTTGTEPTRAPQSTEENVSPDGTDAPPRQFDQSVVDQATADVEAAADIETQEADLVARIEGAGGEILEFDQLDGLVSSDQIPVLTPQDMVGWKIFPTIADRTAAAALYTGIEGAQLDVAVPLLGGPLFPLRMSNWENDVVWANRGASVTSAKEGKLAAGATHMLVTMGDQNMHISNTTVNYAYMQTFFAKMQSSSPPDAAGITKFLRAWQSDAKGGSTKTQAMRKDIQSFPGFDDRQALIDWTHKISFDARKQLMKLFSTAEIQGMGGPNVQAILDATREQALAGMNWGDGLLVLELDRGGGGGSFTKLGTDGTSPHPDFPLGIRGRVAGRLETPLGWKTLWKDWVAANADKENPRRAFELSRPIVEITEQLAADLGNAASAGVPTPLHAKLVSRLIDGDMRRSGVAKTKGGIGPADYFNEATTAAAGGTGARGPIRADLKALNAGIKAGEIVLAQVGDARIFYAVEGESITSVVNNEGGTQGLGETVAVLDAIRQGARELVAQEGTFLYDLGVDLGFTPTTDAGVLRLEGDTDGFVTRYIESGPAGLVGAGAGTAGRATWRDGYGSGVEAAGQNAGAELAAAAASSSETGNDTLASRAGRVAAVLKTLKPEALANLGLTEQDATALQADPASVSSDPRTLNQGNGDPLGRITLPDDVKTGESLIQLFEGANPSTMVHEFGHYLIEVMRVIGEGDNAPQSIIDDLATVHAWMEEITGQPVTGAYNTAQQEAWAEAWENYLMTGSAPSPSLKTVFRKFALWLADVYKTATGAGTQASPEVRDVMDRLLATEQEIAVTKLENAEIGLFSERPPFMTEQDWDTYKKVAERGDAEAQGKVLAAAMKSAVKKQGAEWKAFYARALVQATDELSKQREYVLIAALGDKDNNYGRGARLDRDILISMFGTAILNDLKALKSQQLIYVKDGADPDQVADMFGFRNGAEMVQTLRTVKPLKEQAELNARAVADKEAPPLTEAEMREEAEAALKNPTRIEVVAREGAALVKASGGVASTWTVMNRAAKARAENLVGQMNVKQAGNYRQFAVAAQKAAREAQAELAKVVRLADGTPKAGGMQAMRKAAEAKRKQLLNDHMYTIARERAKSFDRARKRFAKAQTNKGREKVDPAYMDQADMLLEQYDFGIRTAAQVKEMGQARQAKMTLAEFLLKKQDEGVAGELSVYPSVLLRTAKTNYSELTVDQLEAVVDSIDNLIHAGKGVKKSFLANEKLMYAEMVGEITLTMAQEMKGAKKPDRESGQRSGLPKFLGALNQNIETALTTIRRMDGWKDNGPAMRYIFRPLQRAAAQVEERREQETVRLKDVYSKHYTKKEIRALNDKRKHGIYVPELGDTFSKAGLLSIALNSGNDGNFQRLTDVDGVKGDGAYDAARVNAALKAHMTDADWRFVQDMWDHIDSFWPEISSLEREVTGVLPKKVVAVLQVEAPDFVKGGYYPIQYDKDMNIAAFLNGADDAYKDATGGRSGKAQTRHGHTEARMQSTGMALDLNLGVAENHIMKVVHDLSMRKPINHAVKVLNDPAIGTALNTYGRTSDLQALRSWLVDTAAGDSISADSMGAVMRYARKALTVKYIGFSLATLLLQPTGAIQAGVVVGNRALASGYTKYMGRASYWNNFIQTNSAHMRLRVRAVNREVNEFAREARTAETAASGPLNRFTNAITSLALAPIGHVQYWTVDIPVFIAAFETARGEGRSEADAISLAENAVDRASGSGSFLNRASFERGTSSENVRRTEYIKTFTMLASYVHSKYNAYLEVKGRTDFSSPLQSMLFAGSMMQLFAIEAAMVSAYRAIGDERDDDEPTGKWLGSIIASEITGLHPVTRPLSSYVSGYGIGATPLGDFADLLAKGAGGTFDIVSGEGDINDWLKAFDAGATPFMLPTGQLKKIIRAITADDPAAQLGRVAMGLSPLRE